MDLCYYYQATINRPLSWYFVAILRSYEYICFDRTLDVQTSTFEFFVPDSQQKEFCSLMDYFHKEGIVTEFKQCANRLEAVDSIV